MEWHLSEHGDIIVRGILHDGVAQIVAEYKDHKIILFEKVINSWQHQEFVVEDVYHKFHKKLNKLIQSIPTEPIQLALWLKAYG